MRNLKESIFVWGLRRQMIHVGKTYNMDIREILTDNPMWISNSNCIQILWILFNLDEEKFQKEVKIQKTIQSFKVTTYNV